MKEFIRHIWHRIEALSHSDSGKYFWKASFISLGLILVGELFHLCNEIPTCMVDIDVSTYAMPKSNLELYALIGEGTRIRNPLDSSIWSPFYASSRNGIIFGVQDISALQSADSLGRLEPLRRLKQLKEKFPEDKNIDSLHSMIHVGFKFNDSGRRYLSVWRRQYYSIIDRSPDIQDLYSIRYIQLIRGNESGEQWLLFNPPQERLTGNNVGKNKHSWNLLALHDISQSYVAVRLMRTEYPANAYSFDWGEDNWDDNPMSLILDFGSPISPSHMDPEPDEITMTRVVFKDPQKIRTIIDYGVVFHVIYTQNENFQSMKMFLLTSILTGLFTWFVSVLVQWGVALFSRGKKKQDVS